MAKKKDVKLVVGLGASAGGLMVLKELIRTFPRQSGIAFIIIQHLDPTHKSLLSELLDKESSIPVQNAKDKEKLKADHIYVIPPNAYLELKDGAIILVEPEHSRGSRKAIDHFFRSLAEEYGEAAVGIVLSGSGSDGTAGLRAIKAAGGLALAQDPDTAPHPSMPLNAIEAGIIDKIVKPEEIIKVLKDYIEHPLTIRMEAEHQEKTSYDSLEEITSILRTLEAFNLHQYKPSTVHRRISRRMALTGVDKYQDYLKILRKNEEERKRLTKDLLINVTDFFRDPEAFEVLKQKVLPDIIKNIEKDEDIRVWVPGCASGEEAYTLAILLLEARAKAGKENDITIFATDIDEHAISIARKGIYPESITDEVPTTYLEKYFVKSNNKPEYRIKSEVRDLISFATQNVAIHPPFSHMHLISCRNLLIYLKKEIQDKVINSFYFSLETGSYLFLGSSESIDPKSVFFKTLSKKWRIYQKISHRNGKEFMPKRMPMGVKDFSNNLSLPNKDTKSESKTSALTRSDQIRNSILDALAPPLVVVSQDGQILYNHGQLKPYLIIPQGEPQNNITQLVYPSLRSRIRSGLYKVRKTGNSLSFHATINEDDKDSASKTVRVELTPLKDLKIAEGEVIGVAFYDIQELSADQRKKLSNEDEPINQNLEQELSETKDELKNTIEELETSTEELKASHEEALSSNEELQSANEELEASSEELRSLNEEIGTVNAQLKEKIQELQKANNDVENFFASTDIPTIFLNPNLEIQRFTPSAERLLKISASDVGRPIYSLGKDLLDDELTLECRTVIQNFLPRKKEKKTSNGRWYIQQISPYRTADRRIEGVVIVFHDITEMKELSKRAESRERQQSVVATLGMLAMSGVEPEELMQQAVRQIAHVLDADYCKVLKYQPEHNNLRMLAGVGWQEGLIGKVTVPHDNNSQAGYTLHSQEPVIVRRLSEEKRFSGPALLTDHGVVSGMSCVINHSSPPYGVLGVHTRTYREFTIEDSNFLLSVANMLSAAIRSREAQDEIFNSEEQFRTLANSIPQLAWMTDNTGYVYWYNKRWYEFTGTTLNEMLGWGWQKVQHPEHVERVTEIFKEHLKSGKEWEDTFPLRGADGVYRWFLSRAKPIQNKSGEITHWFGTNTDITEQLELEDSLKQAVSQLEETDKRKNEFLAILGHELRNPLAAIKGSTDIIEMGIAEPQEVIGILQRGINTMSKLLDDLLDLSRIARNKIMLDLELVNIHDILINKLVELTPSFEAKDQKVEQNITEDLYINGDSTRMDQIFSNLLNNANKFTPEEGKITVSAWLDKNDVVIKIKDEGIGIEDEVIDKIFDPFFQISPYGETSSGLGIGLSLVKNLTELHKGTIEVKSEGLNKGTSFLLRFPALQVKNRKAEILQNDNGRSLSAGIKVVLVEDNADILLTISSLFKSLGCLVFSASNAKSGIELIHNKTPDVAFVDIGLPDATGYEVASNVRSKGFKNILVAASGYGHQEAREKSQDAGFDFHIAKPLTLKEIKEILLKVNTN